MDMQAENLYLTPSARLEYYTERDANAHTS